MPPDAEPPALLPLAEQARVKSANAVHPTLGKILRKRRGGVLMSLSRARKLAARQAKFSGAVTKLVREDRQLVAHGAKSGRMNGVRRGPAPM